MRGVVYPRVACGSRAVYAFGVVHGERVPGGVAKNAAVCRDVMGLKGQGVVVRKPVCLVCRMGVMDAVGFYFLCVCAMD